MSIAIAVTAVVEAHDRIRLVDAITLFGSGGACGASIVSLIARREYQKASDV